MSDTPLLRLDEVSRIYGEEVKVHALDGVSLDIKVGEFVSIVGPSGSGKSTMLGLLGLLDLPSLGTLSVDGTSVADLSDHDRSTLRGEVVGFIFQQFHLIPHLDARRNVETALLYRQMSPREWASTDQNSSPAMLSAAWQGSTRPVGVTFSVRRPHPPEQGLGNRA